MGMNVFNLCSVVLFVLLSRSILAENSGQCKIAGLTDDDWDSYVLEINSTQINETIKTFNFTGNLVVESVGNEFFTAEVSGNILSIGTSQAFENFDSTSETSRRIVVFKFQCDEDSLLSYWFIKFVITRVQSKAPIFSQTSYEYKIPMPIYPNLDISIFGPDEAILATSTSSHVQFMVEPNDFEIEPLKNGKEFVAALKSPKPLRLSKDTEYTITAINDVKNGLNSSVKVTIKVDEASSLPSTPKLSSPTYIYSYSVVDEKPRLTNDFGGVISYSDVDDEDINVSLVGDFNYKFDLILNKTSQTIDIDLHNGEALPSDLTTKAAIVFRLTVEAQSEAVSTIVINLPQSC